jgi:hypothetical protein
MGVTQGEMRMWQDINSIASSLNRIANLMEAAEQRARKKDEANTLHWKDAGDATDATERG